MPVHQIRVRAVGLVLAWLAYIAAEAEITIPPDALPPARPLPEPQRIGPFRVGMTFDEARAADRRVVDPTGARPIPMSAVAWKYVPSSDAIQSSYPHDALNVGQEAFVEATCQIQGDLSLICTNVVVDPPEHAAFKDSVVDLLPLYESGPLLKNGEPTVAAWTLIKYQFKIEQ